MIKLPDIEGLQERVRVGEQAGPGPRLRAAREALGVELEDIAKQMRLHPQIIVDLEADKFSDHLALVFVRGYLRSYAGLIGLDPEQVVGEFNAMGHKEDRDLPDLKAKTPSKSRMRSQDMHRAPMSPTLKWAGALCLAVIMGAIVIAYNHEPADKLYVGPVVTDPNQAALPTDSVDPENNTVTTDTVPPAVAAPTPGAPAPRAATAAPGAAAASTTPAGSTPPGAAQATDAAPATPVPAPAPSRKYDDDDFDTDASNDLDPRLPKPSRTTS